jgi:hypothetical protein
MPGTQRGLPVLPTPEEIKDACRAIQSTWSDTGRISRMRPDMRPIPWELLYVPGAAFDR